MGGHGPYALGYQTAFDSGKSALTKHNLALNYNAGDMILHATSSDFKSFGGGIYLKNSSQLETGVTCSSAIGGASNFAIGAKYKCKDYGVNITEKWNTDNSLNTTVDYEKLMPGMKLTLDGNFQPNTGDKAGKFKTEYKHEKLVFNSDLNLAKSPVVNLAASLGHGPYALGYQTAFDSGKSALTKHNLALHYNAGD